MKTDMKADMDAQAESASMAFAERRLTALYAYILSLPCRTVGHLCGEIRAHKAGKAATTGSARYNDRLFSALHL